VLELEDDVVLAVRRVAWLEDLGAQVTREARDGLGDARNPLFELPNRPGLMRRVTFTATGESSTRVLLSRMGARSPRFWLRRFRPLEHGVARHLLQKQLPV
jgi:hypothetical protein